MAGLRKESQIPVVGRMLWMLVGPAAMALCLIGTLNSPPSGWITIADGLYALALAATIAGRFIEFQGGDPRTATYEPATKSDLRRYVFVALFVGLAIWMAAKLIHNYVL